MDNFQVLDPLDFIKHNPTMYAGSTYSPIHLFKEIIDNAIDLLLEQKVKNIFIDIPKPGRFLVIDDGPGFPRIQVQLPDGSFEDSIVASLTKPHSGSKFHTKTAQHGQNGVGTMVVNALSKEIFITVRDQARKNIIHHYVFRDAKFCGQQEIENNEAWSTRVEFEVNPKYFTTVEVQTNIIEDRLRLVNSFYDKCNIYFKNQQIPKISLEEFAKSNLQITETVPIFHIEETKGNEKIRLFFTYDAYSSQSPIINGDVNLNICEGTFIANITTLVYNTISEFLSNDSITKSEVLGQFRAYVSLTIISPSFDSQTKIRLVKNVSGLVNLLKPKLSATISTIPFFKNHFDALLAAKSQQKAAKVLKVKKARVSSENPLADCKNIPGKTLFILEGDSAGGTLKKIRNPTTDAIFPLTGKILNVVEKPIDKAIESKKIKFLLEAIGIDLSKSNQTTFRYDQIKILADADSIDAESEIIYENTDGLIECRQIQHIDNIKNILSVNKTTGNVEKQLVLNVISHEYSKKYIKQITTIGNYKINCTDDHVVYVYNTVLHQIEELSPLDINLDIHYLLRSKYLPQVNKKIVIDITNNIINEMKVSSSAYILLPFDKYMFDLDDSLIRINIKDRVNFLDNPKSEIAQKCNINIHTLYMYINGKDNTFIPLMKLKKLQQYVSVDLTNTVCKIQLCDSSIHYIEKGILFNRNKIKIKNLIEISEDLAYIIGQYIGDGCHGSSINNPYEINFAMGDGRYTDKLVKIAKKSGYNNIVIDKSNSTCTIVKIKSIELCSILDYLGLTNKILGPNKFIPNLFFSCDELIRVNLLNGLYDSDGSYFRTYNSESYRLNYATSSLKLCSGIIILLKQLGITPLISERKSGKIGKLVTYNLNINKTEYLAKIPFIKTTIKDTSDYRTININDHLEAIKITSIETIDYKYDKVYDLEVLQNNNFTVGLSGAIFHNSDGKHIVTLATIVLWKFAPSLIKSNKLSMLLPPLYGAKKKNTFIPIYDIKDVDHWRNQGYTIQRFKGLGEMNPDDLKEVVYTNPKEYIIQFPKSIEEAEILVRCLTDTSLKRAICKDSRFGLDKLLNML